MSDYVAEAVIEQQDFQTAQSSYEGLDGLARAIIEAYIGSWDALEEHLQISITTDLQILQNRLSDRLYEIIEEPGEITRLVGQIGPLDRIAEKIGLDPVRTRHFNKPQAILKALGISDIDPPEGISHIIIDLNQTYRRICSNRKLQADYDRLLGQGINLCKKVERILRQLVLFYASEALRSVVTKTSLPKDLTNDIEKVVQGESTLGLTYGVLKRFDNYLQSSGSTNLFKEVFQRPSIFSPTQLLVSGRGELSMISKEFELPTELITALTTLEEIKRLRNSLPHDESVKKDQSKLDNVDGLHSHLMNLWDHIHRFIDLGEECQLFPITFILTKKSEGIGSGFRLIGIDEYGESIVIPRKHLDLYILGQEYFCWPSSGPKGLRSIVVHKL